MFIAYLHQHLRLYTIGWMNLNVIVHLHVIHLVWDVQLRLLRQKSSIKSTILFWLTDEWKCACWGHKHITWHSDFNFARTIRYEKAIDKMDARLLTVDHKRDRVTISKQCLEMFQRNPDEFLHRFITVDETWIHYFTPETKEQSKQFTRWTSSEEGEDRKVRKVTQFFRMHAV